MKIVERINNKIVEIKKIDNINELGNHELILMEHGDKIKKAIKGAYCVFGNKNLYSVKSMKEAIAINEAKQNKKNGRTGHLCCVCGDWFENLDEKGCCTYCQIS